MSTKSADKHQILNQESWRVDVVGLVPLPVHQAIKEGKIVLGAACLGWSCVGLRDGGFLVWQTATASDPEKLKAPKFCAKFFFPDLKTEGDGVDPLLALTTSKKGDIAYLYAAHPTSGWVVMKKITPADLRSRLPVPSSHSARIRVELRAPVEIESAEKEFLTSLAASNGMVVAGSSSGRLIWITSTVVPLGLHQQLIPMPSASTGVWGRLSSMLVSSSDQGESVANQCACILPVSPERFFSVSRSGSVTQWDVEYSVAASHKANFRSSSLGSLGGRGIDGNDSPVEIFVMKCAASKDIKTLHFIVSTSGGTEGVAGSSNRLHWSEVKIDSEDGLVLTRSHWLSRFPEPQEIEVSGLVTCDNGDAYAAFSPSVDGPTEVKAPVIIMTMPKELDHIDECDIPTKYAPSLIQGTLESDKTTHGCLVNAGSGIGIRARFLPAPNMDRGLTSGTSSSTEVRKLLSHLRSVFWSAYDNGTNSDRDFGHIQSQIPPSLLQARPVDLEETLLLFALELKKKNVLNSLEQHNSLISMLRQSGLYRSTSELARWKLLAIGQELAVVQHLTTTSGQSPWERDHISRLKSFDSPDWLLRIQSSEIQGTHKGIWMAWLLGAWTAATDYRSKRASMFYDIPNHRPPLDHSFRLWTSHSSVQMVLRRQLRISKDDLASIDIKTVETLVEATLQSYTEYVPEDTSSREECARVKAQAISLLRSTGEKGDKPAFELSATYGFFEGLCQISVDHEKKRDASEFSLVPFFDTIKDVDLVSRFTFMQFVLQWHTDAGMYGHTINYGRHSTTDLNHIMQQDRRLHPYRWVQAIRQHDHKGATDSLMENASSTTSTLAAHKLQLSMAKLSNKLSEVSPDADIKRRQFEIERNLELANAQELLLESELSPEDIAASSILSPEKLVTVAMDQFDRSTDITEKTRICFIALVVCASMQNSSAAGHAAHVWAKCLMTDIEMWMEWVRAYEDFSNPDLCSAVMDNTVFGSLLQECRSDRQLRGVTYNPHMEASLREEMMIQDAEIDRRLSRLLRSVARDPAISVESLVVGQT